VGARVRPKITLVSRPRRYKSVCRDTLKITALRDTLYRSHCAEIYINVPKTVMKMI